MNTRAFTVIELMIVLAIAGGFALLIIIPNLKAREPLPAEAALPPGDFTSVLKIKGEVNLWVVTDRATGHDYIVVRSSSSNNIAITPRLPATAAEMKP